MGPRRSYLVVGLVLLTLALAALLLFQPSVRRTVFDPLAEALRALRDLMGSASQDQQWRAAVVVLAALLAVVAGRLVPRWSWPASSPDTAPGEPNGREPLQTLARLLEGAERSPIHRERICQHLDKLLVHAVAEHHNTSLQEARCLVAAGHVDLDPEVRTFLYPDRTHARRAPQRSSAAQIAHVLTVIEQLQQEV